MLQLRYQPSSMLDMIAVREIEGNTLCLRTEKAREREYKAVLETQPVNFSLMSEAEQEAVLEGFRVFLARLSFPLMIHIRIEPYELSSYLADLDMARSQIASTSAVDEVTEDHIRFVHNLASIRALLQRKFYLIVAADRLKTKRKTRSEIADLSKSELERRCADIFQDLERMGLHGRRLNRLELVHYYQSCLHARAAKAFPLTEQQLEAADVPVRSTKEETARALNVGSPVSKQSTVALQSPTDEYPNSINVSELLAPGLLDIKPKYVRVHHDDLDEYLRCYAVIGYPSRISPGWLDRLVQIDEPSIEVVMHIQPLEAATYTARLSHKLTGYRATRMLEERRGRDHDPYIHEALKQVEALREKLVAQDEQVFGVSLYLLVRASSRLQLNERSERLLSVLKSLELRAVALSLEHHRGWLCTLPDGRDVLKRKKILDTSSLLTAFPFASTSLSMEHGILEGVMPNGSLVIVDPLSDELQNGHAIKFAKSGAGKSYHEKVYLSRCLQRGYKVIVFDPEDEYRRMCEKFGGTNIRLSPGSLQINPFLLPTAEKQGRNLLEEKYQSLHVLFDLLLAEKGGQASSTLSQREKAYLNVCMSQLYQQCGITADPATHTRKLPTMRDLYHLLRQQTCGPDTFGLADRLQRHVSSFPDESIGLGQHQFVVFNLRDLDVELRPVGLFLATDAVWTEVRSEQHPVPRILSVDEAWALLQFDEGGRFLSSLARRARKYNLCLRVTTQNVQDFVKNEHGMTIIQQSEIKYAMKQDHTTIEAVSEALQLSQGARKFLLGCAKGEGLYFAKGLSVPMKVVASPIEHSLAVSGPQEVFI
ncbi:VirB4 family type IV secretion system protein [Dictyobacter formicarum]|uniref:TraG P-loop domain-containing protein n=1 Tax=Dictyobacter formicarum TaxID=2778368 RepID=A0ABQ3VWJ5_9CHLR|nr:DUF87 domain-containing protein [Dictyobacter formicarum]GHO89416.1 hypothetical protein KSZ_74220 [Dictyobacter formicarum]